MAERGRLFWKCSQCHIGFQEADGGGEAEGILLAGGGCGSGQGLLCGGALWGHRHFMSKPHVSWDVCVCFILSLSLL